MLKELAQYIVGLSKPELVNINDKIFSDRNLKRYDYSPPEPLHFKSIQGLLEYIRSNCDFTLNDSFNPFCCIIKGFIPGNPYMFTIFFNHRVF